MSEELRRVLERDFKKRIKKTEFMCSVCGQTNEGRSYAGLRMAEQLNKWIKEKEGKE